MPWQIWVSYALLTQTRFRSHYKLQLIQSACTWQEIQNSTFHLMSVCVHRLLKTDVRSMSCLSQAERSTWCAGTKTRPRRRGLISSRRQEIKYSVTHFFKKNTGPTDSPDERLFITLNVITGGLCPHPGPVWDQEGLGVCWGFQEKVQDSQRAGELLIFIFWNISQHCHL